MEERLSSQGFNTIEVLKSAVLNFVGDKLWRYLVVRSREHDIYRAVSEIDIYREDLTAIEALKDQVEIRLLVHNYAAVKEDGKWVLHTIGKMSIEAVVLLLEKVVSYRNKKGLDTSINITSSAQILYDGVPLSIIFLNNLRARIDESSVLAEGDDIRISSHRDENIGFSTGGELENARRLWRDLGFVSLAPYPHLRNIELLAYNKGLKKISTISTDGIMYHLDREGYERFHEYIRNAWITFSLYEIAKRVILGLFDPTGKILEKVARRIRSEDGVHRLQW